MGHGFSAVGAIVDDDSEAIFGVAFLAGDLADFQEEMAQEFQVVGRGFGDANDWFFGNEKKVDRGLGRNVAEAEAEIVFVDDVGGNFTGDDFFEQGHLIGRPKG